MAGRRLPAPSWVGRLEALRGVAAREVVGVVWPEAVSPRSWGLEGADMVSG